MRRRGRVSVLGFSLVELLVVVSVMGVLVMVAAPAAELVGKRSREQELKAALVEIRGALDGYKKLWDEGRISRRQGESGYPESLDVLVDGFVDAKSPTGERIRLLRRVPVDPMVGDSSTGGRKATWGLRSYESDDDNPRPGRDVFDVYSTSHGVGLNGVPYAKW